ncbi:hypothetical protein VHA01S_009_00510 [Vibrio halioticoli NBRC 102217]|uniref:DUF2982 domain-containing protein n=1 Tax=Vibrio halioticoli NBRC 102217 TaxID=1219072 RepID=V5F0W6_9VIBR|nr:DUF2982 domain-containing protein [Vibrio halioticoli]GAD88764.1 hypothetical protein VHA01S_009_00510 [Vibrio halioticoli NBRC 102217]
MSSLQLTNQKIILGKSGQRLLTVCAIGLTLGVTYYAHTLQGKLGIIFIGVVLYVTIQQIYLRGIIRYTLTDSHFQQHTYKGGWVVQWPNVAAVGLCQSHNPSTAANLPWIGIRLNDPVPFIQSTCPRLISHLLLEQRSLLYLGAMETQQETLFQEQVLDSRSITINNKQVFTGLQASMLRRMQYQREYWGYDIFIATADLERDAEEFVGLLRRYWASSSRHMD